jgi:hypothetical protein
MLAATKPCLVRVTWGDLVDTLYRDIGQAGQLNKCKHMFSLFIPLGDIVGFRWISVRASGKAKEQRFLL